MIDLPANLATFGNVEDADFLLRLTENEPWEMLLRWETDAGAAIDMSGPGWTVGGLLRLPDADRPVTCAMTAPQDGWFVVRLGIADVDALSTAKPARLVVTIEDPAGKRFHFVFAAIRREL